MQIIQRKTADLIPYVNNARTHSERAIKSSSEKNNILLDFFGGSGSTMIACEKTNRINYSMELDPKYCDVIVKRWQDFTGKQATLKSTGEPYGSHT
jgi:DNA modification methylase